MIYRDKYFQGNITVSILAYHDNRVNDNTIHTKVQNHYLLYSIVDATSKCIVPLGPSVLPL